MKRFPLGLCHYVYDVALVEGGSVVVRVAKPENRPMLRAAVEWASVLRLLGVPLPAILEAHLDPAPSGDLAYLVLERLPGVDLGTAYPELTSSDRIGIARSVVELQAAVGSLPLGGGFGYVSSPAGPFPRASWPEVLQADLERSRARMASDGPSSLIDRVGLLMADSTDYLESLPPRAFLDDLTTKNVIVHRGALAGVVDVDAVCYGDPLYTPALTRTALAADGEELDYVEAWLGLMDLSADAVRAFDLYTAVFVVGFLSEHGQLFNREQPAQVSAERRDRLLQLFDSLVP